MHSILAKLEGAHILSTKEDLLSNGAGMGVK